MSTLEVLLGPVRVGVLERFEDEEYLFSFDPEWLRLPSRPVLGQLFEDRRPHDIATSGLPCWFSHLLPQGPLRRAIARQYGLTVDDDFELLELLGEDLPGAVTVRPIHSQPLRRPTTNKPPLTLTAGPLHFSLAGAQWKLSVREGDRGLTLPVQGKTGSWIAKFHDPEFPGLPRVELATMSWARACGLKVPLLRGALASEFAELPPGIPTGDGAVFLIERFDRNPQVGRIHIEDFAQVLDQPDQFVGSYEHIAVVLAYLAPESLRQFCERLVFCVLCGNTDAHLKNWSLIYPDGRRPTLSPAYDIIASVLYVPRIKDELALTLNGSRRFEDVKVESFQLFAEVANHPFAEISVWVQQAARRIRSTWHQDAAQWPFLPEERQRLDAHMARVPLGQ